MPKINSLEVVHQDTNKDSYQNLHDILVDLNQSLALNKEVVDKDARASIENLLEMYVNDKEAFLRSLLVLTAEFKESKAQYSQEILLKASELEALARKTTKLSAEIRNNSAMILEEQTARVTSDMAFAQQVTTLESTFNNNLATISEELTTVATATEANATAITTLSATVGTKNRTFIQTTAPTGTTGNPLVSGDLWFDSDDKNKPYRYNGSSWVEITDGRVTDNTAAISTETTARVNGDSALSGQITSAVSSFNGQIATINSSLSTLATHDSAQASDITTLEARLDTGDFASVKTQSSATASKVAGIEAKWGVTTNVNGYVAGIQLLNGGSTSSSFTVDATKFIVKKPNGTNGIEWNGSNSTLTINGDVYANAFYGTGVIGTTNVAGNAITNGSSVYSGTTPVSVGITTTGGSIFAWCTVRLQAPAYDSATVSIFRDGAGIQGKSTYGGDTGKSEWITFAIQDIPPAGYHTYSIASDYTAYECYLMVLETKR